MCAEYIADLPCDCSFTFYGGPEEIRRQPRPPQYQYHSQSYIPEFGGAPTLSDHEIVMRIQSVEARRIHHSERLRPEFEESRQLQDVMDSARRATQDRGRPRGRSASPVGSHYSSSVRSNSKQSVRTFAGRRGARGGYSGGGQPGGKGRA